MTSPLTTEQVETIVRVWAETGNQSEAARQAGRAIEPWIACLRAKSRERTPIFRGLSRS